MSTIELFLSKPDWRLTIMWQVEVPQINDTLDVISGIVKCSSSASQPTQPITTD